MQKQTDSQSKSAKTVVMWPYFLVPVKQRAGFADDNTVK